MKLLLISQLQSYLYHRPSKFVLIKQREPKPDTVTYNYYISRPVVHENSSKSKEDGGLGSALGALSSLTGGSNGDGNGSGRGRGDSEDGEGGRGSMGHNSGEASDNPAVVDSSANMARSGEPLFELIYMICAKLNAVNTAVDLTMCYANLYNILHVKPQT